MDMGLVGWVCAGSVGDRAAAVGHEAARVVKVRGDAMVPHGGDELVIDAVVVVAVAGEVELAALDHGERRAARTHGRGRAQVAAGSGAYAHVALRLGRVPA